MKKKVFLALVLILALVMCFASCKAKKTIEAFTVVKESITLEYEVGATPDFSGIKAVVNYSDGSVETVGADALDVGTIDTSAAGTKELVVKYKGFEGLE